VGKINSLSFLIRTFFVSVIHEMFLGHKINVLSIQKVRLSWIVPFKNQQNNV